jgi:lipoprotein
MKKLFMLLAVAGIFASCSKETPVVSTGPKAQDQEAPVTLSDGGADGEEGIRLSLRLDVENFEEVAGGFDATQQARAVFPTINTGAADKKLIDLRAYVDGVGPAKDRLMGMIYIYDRKENKHIPFNAPFRVYNDGKSIGYDGLVSGFDANGDYKKYFAAMVKRKMQDCYVSVIIGNDPWSLNFTNKGPHIISSWDDGVTLPGNFVMLKSEANPLWWRDNKNGKVHEISTLNNTRMKLRMMGYLMMLRIRNTFPQYIERTDRGKRERALRPPMWTRLDLSPTLSAAQEQQLSYDNNSGTRFYMAPKVVDETHFTGKNKKSYIGQPPRYGYMEYKQTLMVPVSTTPRGELPAKGDYVVAMYFPQADDYGSVAIRREYPFFYDGSVYSLAPGSSYQTLGDFDNKLEKFRPKVGSKERYKKALNNRVYYPIIEISPKSVSSPVPVKNSWEASQYDYFINRDPAIKWEPIP